MSHDGPPAEFTIDELAAHTGVPSRTIRFYQSKGTLQKPEIRGRKAFYVADHVERLKLIGDLQDRGLRIRAIRDLVQRIDRGELVLSEWLGLEARLQEPWDDEEPRVYTEAEMDDLLGKRRAGLLGDLMRLGFVQRHARSYVAPSPRLLEDALRLRDAGVDLSITKKGFDLMDKHLGRLSQELVNLYVKNAGDGFGATGSAADLAESFASIRPVAMETVQLHFARQMQRILSEMVTSGAAAKVTKPRR